MGGWTLTVGPDGASLWTRETGEADRPWAPRLTKSGTGVYVGALDGREWRWSPTGPRRFDSPEGFDRDCRENGALPPDFESGPPSYMSNGVVLDRSPGLGPVVSASDPKLLEGPPSPSPQGPDWPSSGALALAVALAALLAAGGRRLKESWSP